MSGYIPKKIRNGILGTKKDQKGLKTHGSPATLGGHRFVSNVIKRRVAPLNAPWLPRAPFNQSIAGGVGRINAPRFKCGTNCFGHNCDYPPSEVDINTIQQFFKHKNNNVEYTTICWDRVECADNYYVCFYDSDFHLVLSKTVEDNAIVLWLDDEKKYKIKYFSVQACNTHGCSELYYVNVLSCDPLKIDKDSKSISSNEYVPIDARYHKTGSEEFYLISVNWLFNDNFYTSDIYDVKFSIDSNPPVSIKDSVWLNERYNPIEKFNYGKTYNFELLITCYYGTHKYSGNFFVKPPPPTPPTPPTPPPTPRTCNCSKILPLDNFQHLPYPSEPVENYYGLSITRNDHNDSDCLKYITSYEITVIDTEAPTISNIFSIPGNIFGTFILTNTSVSTTPLDTQLDHSFKVSNSIDTKIYKVWSDLEANHEYEITIKSNLTDSSQCSITFKQKTQDKLPSPPPPPPPPPTPTPTPGGCCSCPTKISDASLCNLYITMYGNSSFEPVKKIFETTLPSKATALANWLIIKDWFSTIGNKYVQFIKNFKNTKYIAWNATDHAVIFPPTSPDLPTGVKNYTTGATTFNSPNGSILVGVSGDDINEASKPLILTEFLVPLQKTLYNRNITDLSYIELAYDIFPDPKDAFFAMDIGSYSQEDTRFGPCDGPFPITDTTSLYRIPWINKPQFEQKYIVIVNKKKILKKYQSGNIYIGNGQEGDPFANPKVLPSESYCGRAAFYYHDSTTNTIKFQEANGTYGTINQKDISGASGSPNDEYNYQNSHPLDNMHQYFITIYLTNQKIMEYNFNNPSKKVPLITSLSLDGEGAGQYLDDGPKNTYPAADQDTGELTALKFFTTKYPHATKINCGLGDAVGIGYVNYLYNRYMPAECLPFWRVNPSSSQPQKNTTAYVPNMYDFSKNYQNKMKLWDQSYPWNIGQQRNFSAEAGVNYKTGTLDIIFDYANTTRNYNWKKIKSTNNNRKYGTKLIYPATMHTSDGIQRYNLATIKYQGNAFKRNNEGFWHSFIEAYNIGENQPPIYAFPTNLNHPINIFEKYDPIDMTINGGNQGNLIDTNNIGLPIVDSNNIISNFNNKLGSGCYTGLNITCSALPPPNIPSDCASVETPASNPTECSQKCPTPSQKCPIRSTLPDNCKLNSNVYFCPCTDNIIGDHFKRNCITNTLYIKMLNSYQCREGYSQTGTLGAKSPAISDIYMRFSTSDHIPPLDGRGFKDLSGLTTLQADLIKNGTKHTDGCYCPLDFPFVQPVTLSSKWDISLNNSFYNRNNVEKSTLDGQQDNNDGSSDTNKQNIGPIGNVLVLQFAYMGATFTKDPSQPGPQYGGTGEPTWPSDAIYKKQGKTFQQDVFGSLMTKYKSQWNEKSWPPYEPITNSKIVGSGGDNWKDNGTIQKTSMGYGDNTNAFGIIEDVNTVQNLMYGLSNIMCGPVHQSRANIGMYSIEFVNNKLTADEGLANF
jgi:hypothetical protein